MKIIETGLDGAKVIIPQVFYDPRGYFMESFSSIGYNEAGIYNVFVQDNESLSQKGTLRGMHFQEEPHAQAKLVRVIKGAVMDVIIDLRKESPTFGKHYKVMLDEVNKFQLFVPQRFAHGFIALEDDTIFSYKCDKLYNKAAERGIKWDDPFFGIKWPMEPISISEKDQKWQLFKS